MPPRALAALMRRQRQQSTRRPVEVPRPSVGEVRGQRRRVVLQRHPHVGDLGVLAVRQRKVDEPVHPCERHRRFGPRGGQQLKPAARPAGEHEHEHLGQGHVPLLPRRPHPAPQQPKMPRCPDGLCDAAWCPRGWGRRADRPLPDRRSRRRVASTGGAAETPPRLKGGGSCTHAPPQSTGILNRSTRASRIFVRRSCRSC